MRCYAIICLSSLFLLLIPSIYGKCVDPFVSYGDSCYYFHNITRTLGGHTYNDSRVICQNFGGDLISIADKNESAVIANMFENAWVKKWQRYWIGLNDMKTEGKYVWTDGTPYDSTTFENWKDRNGTDDARDCVMVSINGSWMEAKCISLLGFVCERSPDAVIPVNPTLPPYPQASSAPRTCEVGWKAWGTSCYGVITGMKKTWIDARHDCERRFSDLVIIGTQAEQDFFTNLLRPYSDGFWIGVTDKYIEGKYMLVNGSETTLTNWLPNEPNNGFGSEDCVSMRGGLYSGGWNDNNCKSLNSYICEKNSGIHTCPQDWLTYGDYCYQLNAHPIQRFSWEAARSTCLDYNKRWEKKIDVAEAELVSILSVDEQKMLYNELLNIGVPIEENYFWIGLQKKKENGKWTWTDRSQFMYQNWQGAKEEEEHRVPFCVKSSLDSIHSGWVIANCTEKHIFVCKVKRGQDRCYDPLGMQNFRIPDSAITTNHQMRYSTPAAASRLYMKPGSAMDGAWCVTRGSHKVRPYLQVDFGRRQKITYLGVQGKANSDAMVTQFVMFYSQDGKTWDPYWKYSVRFRINPFVYLTRNTNRDVVVHFTIKYPLVARYVRIYPYVCHIDCCMRIEFYGCAHEENSIKCGKDWREDNTTGHCYSFYKEKASWDDAASYCLNHGGNLLSITSKQEKDYITKELEPLSGKIDDYWIGFSDLGKKGMFRWEDRSVVTLTNWESDNPLKDTDEAYRIDNEECFEKCGKAGGLCLSFCGHNGYCCRRGWTDCPLHLRKAAADYDKHVCVRAAGEVMSQCVAVASKNGKWLSKNCDTEKHFICKRNYNAADRVKKPFSTNWKTDADFYWPMNSVVNGSILGSTPGTANGTFTTVPFPAMDEANSKRNALSFDGTSSYLVIKNLQGTCASNPDASNCVNGLSVSFVFRYDEKSSTDAKFVADNMGQGNVATLGYKVFIKLGHMVVIVLGHEFMYSNYLYFNTSVWNHFAFTWSPLDGLSLYLNGNKTVTAKAGIRNDEYVKASVANDLFIGKSATKPTFTKIKLTSLAIFERALPESEIRRIYVSELGVCKSGQIAHGSYCFEFHTNVVRSHDAKQHCEKDGGSLATIQSPVEQAWLSTILRKYNISTGTYIGLSSDRENVYEKWDDGTTLLYSYWDQYMPQKRYRYYTYQVYVTGAGHWTVPTSSYTRMTFICKKNKVIKTDDRGTQETFNIKIRPGSARTFGCTVTQNVRLTTVTYGRKAGNCWMDQVAAKVLAQSHCNGSTCRDVKIERSHNPCLGKWYSPIFDISYQCDEASSPDLTGCPPGYAMYDDHICYKLYLKELTVDKAIEQCEKDGAQLASVSSSDEEAFLVSMLVQLYRKEKVWIGLKYDRLTRRFSWMDGNKVVYTNWYNGSPDPRIGDYVVGDATHHGTDKFMYWHVTNKNELHPFICRKLKVDTTQTPLATTAEPKGVCPEGWIRKKNSCYFVLKTELSHVDATTACRKLVEGADIVSILTKEENDFVYKTLLNRTDIKFYNSWIGLANQDIVRGYSWRDGSPLSFLNWYTNDPNTGQLHLCVGMNRAGQWWDLPCYSKYLSVCKVAVPPVIITTPAPTTVPTSMTDGNLPRCVYTLGDGTGGSEKNMKSHSPLDCLKACVELKKTDPTVNGATTDTRNNNECYCERNMNSWTESERWQSCLFEYGDPIQSKEIDVKTEYTLKKGLVLTSIDILYKEYSVSFEVMPTLFIEEMASVFHVTTGTDDDVLGSRQPAIWFNSKGNIRICAGINTEARVCYEEDVDGGLPLGTWTSIKVEQKIIENSYQYRIFIDGKQVYSKVNYKIRDFRSLIVYIGSPWHPVQPGKIRNILITGTCCPRMEKGSQVFHQPNELVIQKSQVVPPVLPSLKKEYVLYFEMKVNSINEGISGVVYLATGPTVNEFASGAPHIYFLKGKSNLLQLCTAVHRKLLRCTNITSPSLLNKWSNIEVSQLQFGEQFIYELRVNDKVMFNVKNPDAKTFYNLSVFASEPFHEPIDGSIRNLTIKDLLFCEAGWRTVNKTCYYFSKEKTDFLSAKRKCEDMESHIVTVQNEAENNLLLNEILMDYPGSNVLVYIGLNDRSEEVNWKWLDGSPVSYINWDTDEPNDAYGGEDCVTIKRNGKWRDVPCNHHGYYICEKMKDPKKKTDIVPLENNGYCNKGWVQFGSNCYLFKVEFDDRMEFDEALEYCTMRDGNLVSIHNSYENAFILGQLQGAGQHVWIGLTDGMQEGQFLWTDQTVVNYTNWRGGEPNDNGDEDCGEYSSTFSIRGGWNDVTCKSRLKFVCKKPSLKVRPTTHETEDHSCPDDYRNYRKNCYKLVSTPKSWEDAKKECRKEPKGDLVSIHDVFLQAFLYSMSGQVNVTNWWIGLRRSSDKGDLKWSDNTPLDYDFWVNGQKPVVTRTSEELCIFEKNSNTFDGLWNIRNCSDELPFICQITNKPLVKSPGFLGNCSKGWSKLGGMCYKLFSSKETGVYSRPWAISRQKCKAEGGDLATVNSKEIQNLLSNLVQFSTNSKAWIGLNDRDQEHVWKWSSKKPYQPDGFINWDADEPNDSIGKENCVMMYTYNGRWNDASCSSYNDYICEKPLECRDALGMEKKEIPDDAINATSYKEPNYPKNARLNFLNNASFPDAWCANTTDEHPALTISLGDLMTITYIKVQGMGSNYVITYLLDYSLDGIVWLPYIENGQRDLPGTVSDNQIYGQDVYVRAYFVRLRPKLWKKDACMRVEFYGCKGVCSQFLGPTVAHKLSTSSLDQDSSHAVAPLHFRWCAADEDDTPWYEIELIVVNKITRIMATGTNLGHYTLQFGTNHSVLVDYKGYDRKIRIFPTEPSIHELEYPQEAKIVKILPKRSKKSEKKLCLEVELYGCDLECDRPLGMESTLIDDSLISASSALNDYPSSSARINNINGAWCASKNDKNQYLQIALPDVSKVTYISTQGLPGNASKYVKFYNLQWSIDGNFYRQIQKKIPGNVNGHYHKKVKLEESVVARYIRIIPISYQTAICMRVEIYGCLLRSIYPNMPAPLESSNDSRKGLSSGGKTGILLFFLILVAAVFIIGYLYYRKNKRSFLKSDKILRVHAVKEDEVEIINDDDMEDENLIK